MYTDKKKQCLPTEMHFFMKSMSQSIAVLGCEGTVGLRVNQPPPLWEVQLSINKEMMVMLTIAFFYRVQLTPFERPAPGSNTK